MNLRQLLIPGLSLVLLIFTSVRVWAASPSYDDSLASSLLSLVNNYRTNNGKTALKYNSKLASVAKSRIKAMYEAQILISPSDHTHNIPGFGGFATHSVALGLTPNTASENFTATSGDINKALNNWINSPGHLANMIDDSFVYTGVAVSTNLGEVGDPQIPSGLTGGLVAVQVFSTAEGIDGPSSSTTSTANTNTSTPTTSSNTTSSTNTSTKANTSTKPVQVTGVKPATNKPKIDKTTKLHLKLDLQTIQYRFSKIFANIQE